MPSTGTSGVAATLLRGGGAGGRETCGGLGDLLSRTGDGGFVATGGGMGERDAAGGGGGGGGREGTFTLGGGGVSFGCGSEAA